MSSCNTCDYPTDKVRNVFEYRIPSKFDNYPCKEKFAKNTSFAKYVQLNFKHPFGIINNPRRCEKLRYWHTPQDYPQYVNKFV
jgi:hypothetical protein